MAGEQPGERTGDLQTCPDGPGGPILSGSPNVRYNGIPAARVTDTAQCGAGVDKIVTGSRSVFVNGLPSARITEKLAHGAVIVRGSPNVYIGDDEGACPSGLAEAAESGKPFSGLSR